MPVMVLQKALAQAGVASRREAEKMIASGKVSVNGKIITKLGSSVDLDKDTIAVNGIMMARPANWVYFLLNKPTGVLSTAKDDRGRRTVVDLIKTDCRIVPVGRLDMDTTGLLILTNDGDLVYRLTHPKFENEKEYAATIEIPKIWRENKLHIQLKRLEAGIRIEGNFRTSPAKVKIFKKVKSGQCAVSITIHEGRKHQVRQMLNSIGVSVMSLKRVRIGSLTLDDLALGQYRSLNTDEVKRLKSLPINQKTVSQSGERFLAR